MKHFVSQSFQFGAKIESLGFVGAHGSSIVVRQGNICAISKKICCQIKPKILQFTIRIGQGNFSIAIKQDRSSAQLFRPCWDS